MVEVDASGAKVPPPLISGGPVEARRGGAAKEHLARPPPLISGGPVEAPGPRVAASRGDDDPPPLISGGPVEAKGPAAVRLQLALARRR